MSIAKGIVSPIFKQNLVSSIVRSILNIDETLFTPLDLFRNNEQGVWYDPSDLTTLYQDAAGTIPVAADGDPVGRMEDKSPNGNHATQSVAASRPVYHTDGTLHWLAFDGVDDTLIATFAQPIAQPVYSQLGVRATNLTSTHHIYDAGPSGADRHNLYITTANTINLATASPVVSANISSELSAAMVINAVANNPNSRIDVNGGVVATGITGDAAMGGISLFTRFSLAQFMTADLYGMVISTNGETQNPAQYLAKKTGVTLP